MIIDGMLVLVTKLYMIHASTKPTKRLVLSRDYRKLYVGCDGVQPWIKQRQIP